MFRPPRIRRGGDVGYGVPDPRWALIMSDDRGGQGERQGGRGTGGKHANRQTCKHGTLEPGALEPGCRRSGRRAGKQRGGEWLRRRGVAGRRKCWQKDGASQGVGVVAVAALCGLIKWRRALLPQKSAGDERSPNQRPSARSRTAAGRAPWWCESTVSNSPVRCRL